MSKEDLLEKILDSVAYYCKSSNDFDVIIANIETMQENFEEEQEEEKESR